MLRRSAVLFLLAALGLPVCAQSSGPPLRIAPFDFGSADDPTESLPRGIRPVTARFDAFGGPSYIGVKWRSGLGVEADAAAGPFTLGISGRLHATPAGVYEPDTDETYDVLRLLRYARLEPTATLPLYARVGPLAHVTLGRGHLVRSFQTTTAWDARTVGAEGAVRLPFVELAGFADDVRLGGLVGGQVTLAPFQSPLRPRLRTLRVGVSAVTDLGLPADTTTTAFAADARVALLRLGDFSLSPFVSYARFVHYGSGAGIGAEFASADLIGLGRLGATLAFFQSGDAFIPGYFNAFYSVSNPAAGVWNADAFYADRVADLTVGTPLAEAEGGTSVYLSLRALVFNAFELSSFVHRSYSDSPLSEAGLRLVLTPDGGEAFRFVFEVQRQGRTSLGSLFGSFRDQNVLVFHLDYALAGPARLFIRSRYGFRRVADSPEGAERYLVERRFEPFVGIRWFVD